MPTIEVTSTPLTASTRLRIAMRLTRWLADRGSQAAHAIVVFRAIEPMSYFAGGVPLNRYGEDGEQEVRSARWASVVCRIHPDRDSAYMSQLASEVTESLGLTEGTGHCVVRFEPTRPDRVHFVEAGRLTSDVPAMSAPGYTQEGPADADH